MALSVAVVYVTSRLVAPPDGSLVAYAVWWAGLSATATAVLVVAGRLSRRLLPLAMLMQLSLVFPDYAPSRFGLALRTRTVATLEERLAEARRGGEGRTPEEAAGLLLVLVAELDKHDSLTRGHSERVRAYAQSIGRELGLSRRELDLLNWAALLHDVGKLEVPHEILTKAGRPTEDEWQLLRGHPSAGARLAAPLRDWLGEWGAAIEEHHERWDGTGYPHGLAGPDISLAGRIVAVADVYDVITSSRSYKEAGSAAAAREELARCAGTQFDPTVVRALLSISVRSRRVVTGPLAWLAQVPVLARIPLTPAAGVLSAAAVAAGVTAVAPAVPERVAADPAVRVASAERSARAPVSAAPASERPRATRAAGVSRTTRAATKGARPRTGRASAEPPVSHGSGAPQATAPDEPSSPSRDVPGAAPRPQTTASEPPATGQPPAPTAPVPPVVEPSADPVVAVVQPIVEKTQAVVDDALAPLAGTTTPITEAVQPVTDPVSSSVVDQLSPLVSGLDGTSAPKP